MTIWQPLSEVRYNAPVVVKVGEGMTFVARLAPGASVDGDGQLCDQWQAEHEGEHPECWHDGCCWESNADEMMSLQPQAWMPLASGMEAPSGGETEGNSPTAATSGGDA